MTHAVWTVVAGLFLTGHGVLCAQAPPPVRNWSVSIAIGGASGSSAQGVEAAMRAGGFADPSPCVLFCATAKPIAHPFSSGGQLAPLVTVSRRLGRFMHARVQRDHLELGETAGYRESGQGFGDYVFLRRSVTTWAIMGGVNRPDGGGPWVAAGPALYSLNLQRAGLAHGTAATARRIGAVLAAGLVAPARKRFFVELQGQYRLVGTEAMGPIDVDRFDGSSAGVLPRTGVNFSHGLLLLGCGARL